MTTYNIIKLKHDIQYDLEQLDQEQAYLQQNDSPEGEPHTSNRIQELDDLMIQLWNLGQQLKELDPTSPNHQKLQQIQKQLKKIPSDPMITCKFAAKSIKA
ncbi:MAG: hypothetical protein AB7C96_12265 [Hydrogenovibrio sp.]